MNKYFSVLLLIIIIAGAWYLIARSPVAEAPFVDYKNATYTIDGTVVTLVDGKASMEIVPGSASRLEVQFFGNEVRGDFDGDGDEDIAFLITASSGGSGTFYYVVAALKEQFGYRGTNAMLLGDRIAPQVTEYRDGAIIVNFADRAADEPMTARPSIGKSLYFRAEGTTLRELER